MCRSGRIWWRIRPSDPPTSTATPTAAANFSGLIDFPQRGDPKRSRQLAPVKHKRNEAGDAHKVRDAARNGAKVLNPLEVRRRGGPPRRLRPAPCHGAGTGSCATRAPPPLAARDIGCNSRHNIPSMSDTASPRLRRRDLLSLIGAAAGGATMYQAMTSLGFASESTYRGPIGSRATRRALPSSFSGRDWPA